MTRQVTPSQLRADVYRLVDEVLETGIPLQINRRGRKLLLVAEEPVVDRLSRIRGNPNVIVGDPEDLVHMDWSGEWSAGADLDL